MCSGTGISSLLTFVKKGARNIHVVIVLEQLYLILVTFGEYTTIHFVLATLSQPIYLKFMKKCTYFQCPLVCTQPRKWQANRAGTEQPAAQPIASYSKSWGEEENPNSSLIPAIRWHSECCQTMGNACPPPEGLSCHKFKFPGREKYRALQYLNMMVEDPWRTCSGNQSPRTKPQKHGLIVVLVPCSCKLGHLMITKPHVLGSQRSKLWWIFPVIQGAPLVLTIPNSRSAHWLQTLVFVMLWQNCGFHLFTVVVKITQRFFVILKTIQRGEEYAGMWPKQLNLFECYTRGTLAALKIKTSQFCHFQHNVTH